MAKIQVLSSPPWRFQHSRTEGQDKDRELTFHVLASYLVSSFLDCVLVRLPSSETVSGVADMSRRRTRPI